MPPKGKWDICPEEKGRMSIMNKKVLATAGIAALAVSATVAKADEVTTNDQASQRQPQQRAARFTRQAK